MKRLLALVASAWCAVAVAQQNPAALAARNWSETHERAILTDFMDLLAMPNLARDEAAVRKNANAIVSMLEKRGVKARLLEEAGVPPVAFGEIDTPGPTPTLVFYAHYDGQPLAPKECATLPCQ